MPGDNTSGEIEKKLDAFVDKAYNKFGLGKSYQLFI